MKIPDKSYDLVVVGGGHRTIILEPYLAKAWMTIGLFERNDRFGGDCITDDGTTALILSISFVRDGKDPHTIKAPNTPNNPQVLIKSPKILDSLST